MLPGDAPAGLREAGALLALLGWLLLCLRAWRQQHRLPYMAHPAGAAACQVAYASQHGRARALAEHSARQLQAAGLAAQAVPLEQLPWPPACGQRLLLVVSTYGDGEPPEHARRFLTRLQQPADLQHLQYALLGLGNRQYPAFCAFARHLDQQLRQQGAQALFKRLEADRLDPSVLHQWQRQLAQLSGGHAMIDWSAAEDYQQGQLLERHWLNPGSLGEPLYHLKIDARQLPDWQAGDIAEIAPRQNPTAVLHLLERLALDGRQVMADGQTLAWHLARRAWPADLDSLYGLSPAALLAGLPHLSHRSYSIASLPVEGSLDLLVRLVRHAEGGYGLGSGWLCCHSVPGSLIELRIRPNPAFRMPRCSGPLLLIGNGSGLAGLRSHLFERAQWEQGGHWLLFGERQAAHDSLLDSELQAWRASGHLARLDRVFSRDGQPHRHVQDLLREAADDLRVWISSGGSVLVCGSLQGMGQAVDAVLRDVLGGACVDQLSDEGRYRRDLY